MDTLAVTARDRTWHRAALTGSLVVHGCFAALLVWASVPQHPAAPLGTEPVELVFETPAAVVPAAEPSPIPTPEVATAVPEAMPQPVPVPLAALQVEPAVQPPVAETPPEMAPPVPEALDATSVPLPAPAVEQPLPPVHRAQRQPTAPARAASRQRAELERPAALPTPATGPMPAAAATPALARAPASVDPGWRSAVSAWLLAHKRYPDAARRRGEAGVVGVAFSVARDGRVLVVAITSSSGSTLLDDAVRDMLDRERLPAFPVEMSQPETQVSVKIRYTLE